MAGIVTPGYVNVAPELRCSTPAPESRAHRREAVRSRVCSVKGVEHQLNTATLVLAIKLRISVVVADEHATADTPDTEDREVIPRGEVSEVTRTPRRIARAEPLVVTLNQRARVVNDVDTVVWLVPTGQAVRRPDDDPEARARRQGRAPCV